MKKNNLSKIILMMLILFSILITSVNSENNLLEKPTYKKGDHWEYRTEFYNYSSNGTRVVYGVSNTTKEVIGKDQIVVNGESYDVVIIDQSSVTNYIDGSVEIYSTTTYHREEDLAVVKQEEKRLIKGKTENVVQTYDPPVALFDYPIEVGSQWTINSTIHSSTGNSSQFLTTYQCLFKMNVSVKAGEYTGCYVIENLQSSYNGKYWSSYYYVHPRVGQCLIESYVFSNLSDIETLSNGRLLSSAELVSSSYDSIVDKDETPGFEFIFFLLATVVTIFFLNRN